MTIISETDFILELEDAVKGAAPQRRRQIFWRIAELFLASAERINAHHIGVFDDVLARLSDDVDAPTLARLSKSLSEMKPALNKTARRLALHQDAAVACPVLHTAATLSESDLIEIASRLSHHHLLAISQRKHLSVELTDCILKRNDPLVGRTLAKNTGARISEQGYSTLAALAERDDDVAASLVSRTDMPVRCLQQLLSHATPTSRSRLHRLAPSTTRDAIGAAIASLEAQALARIPDEVDYSEAKSRVLALNNCGKLNDSIVNRYAMHGARINLVAALSLLAGASIPSIAALMDYPDGYGLMVACRASRLDWQTALTVVRSRKCAQRFEPHELEQLKAAFETLSLSIAERTIRYESSEDCGFAITNRLAESRRRTAGARS